MAKNNLPKNGKEGKPFFYFYPADWETDYNLQNCSIAAQGLWIKLLCIMHGGTPRGYLSNQKKPLSDEIVRRRVGLDLDEYKKLLSELKEFGVIRSNECGYYSKRMVRDTEISEIRSKVKKNAWDIKKATIVKSQDDHKMVGDLQINEINGVKEDLVIPLVGKSRKQKNSKTEVEQEIFNHWNNLKITMHGSIDKFLPVLTTTLKVYPKENIIEAMDNLKHVIDSPDCFWTHRWGLHEFLTRKENGIDNFLTVNKPLEKYRKKEDGETVGIAAHKTDRWAAVRHLYPEGKSDAFIETMERRKEYEKIRKANTNDSVV